MKYTDALKQAMTDNPQYNTRLQQAERLAKRWQKLGLMQKMDNPKDQLLRTNTAIMLENQAKQILREANYTSATQYHEQWVGVAMPLVRRFIHKLAAKDFVTIQALSQPAGLVFFLDHQFGSNRRGFQAGNSIYGTSFIGDSGKAEYVMDTSLTAGLYGAGKWGYSLNNIQTIATASAVTGSTNIQRHTYNNDGRFQSLYAHQIASGSMKIVKVTLANLSNPDLNGVQTFHITNGVTDTTASNYISKVFQEYTRINSTTIDFMVLTGDTGSWSGNVTCSYHKQPVSYDRGDFQYKGDDLQTTDINIPEVQFKLTQKPIVPQTRKMKATWTQQLIDDLNAFLAIDGEQQISNQLTDQITLETDLELVALVGKGGIESGNAGYFSIRPGFELTQVDASGNATFTKNTNYYIPDRPSWFRNIGVPMQKVSNMIHQKTGKGGANFAIVSPVLATVLQTIEGFTANTDGTQDWMEAGFTQIGSFRNRYKIYKNPYSLDNAMIMGYRGTGYLDFGAAYCPYIPLIMLPNIMQPTNLTPTKGVYTRYAKTMLRRDYYGVIYVDGLETL